MFRLGLASLILCFLAAPSATLGANDPIPPGTEIVACGDGAGWPPYTFFAIENGQPTKKVLGYDVDVLNRVLSGTESMSVRVEMPPWKRCLHDADRGSKYQIALSSSFNEERNVTYLLTRHYYTVTPHYFYFNSAFPNGPAIASVEDFANYRVCGLFGYNYAGFSIPKSMIDSGTKNFPRLIEKTRRGRCDVFLARFEIFAGFALSGSDYIRDHNLGNAPIPGAPADKFYMLISRNIPYANSLKQILDAGITELERKGELDKMLQRYLATSTNAN